MKSLKVQNETHADLHLIKRAKNAGSMDELLRELMNLSGFTKQQLTHMRAILQEWSE